MLGKKKRHFIFFIQDSEYDTIKSDRCFNLSTRRSKYKIGADDQILIALQKGENEKRVVAEYEATAVKKIDKGILIEMEPIYQAPPKNGLRIDDFIKLSIKTELKEGKAVIEVTESEFIMMASRLVR